ncbi:unnamed protein product [Mytilus edulis]|uniref:Uncharacterized protein n=1 Tax=Mytilus edulis TaxID=6550 RepID=A0A8S3SCT1_MYTED|nr:unnamed protein product [Mytilus edulis]
MSRCHSLSDSDSDSNHDKFDDELNDEEALNLNGFFFTPQKSGAETVHILEEPEVTREMQMAATQTKIKSPEKNTSRKGKSVKNSGMGKALQRKTSESVELPSGSRVTRDNSLQRTRQRNETARTESNHNVQFSDQEEESDYPVYDTCNNNMENGNFSIFSDDSNGNDQSEVCSDENNDFDYELPRIFEGDERFGEESDQQGVDEDEDRRRSGKKSYTDYTTVDNTSVVSKAIKIVTVFRFADFSSQPTKTQNEQKKIIHYRLSGNRRYLHSQGFFGKTNKHFIQISEKIYKHLI